ncbi:MAG: spermine/spermidine synthase domain-containing protein [Promethearchaeota archaeon]|jgi:spermidine synthase
MGEERLMKSVLYFTGGKIIAQSGDIKVYRFGDALYLEHGPGHSLWTDSDEIKELEEQIGQKPKGDCLEIGLGLGVASKIILDKPSVNSLITVEIDPDVIEVYKQLHPTIPKTHEIVNESGLNYLVSTDDAFDFIFLDFYDIIDEDTLPIIKDYVEVGKSKLKEGGEIVGWFDPYTAEEFVNEFFELFGEVLLA